METMRLEQWARMAGGRVSGSPDTLCSDVCTDSRCIREGDLFVALSGRNFDGHDFVSNALEAGAAAAMVADHAAMRWPGASLVVLGDSPLEGFQRLAASWRRSLPVRVVGVTGSNGKTSVKDMSAAVLGARFRVHATSGNYNNDVGVPITLLGIESSHDYAVIEMGMNHAGEIAPLAAMALPDIAVVTNVGRAHIEFLGSREAIAVEKGALPRALSKEAVAILPAGDDYLETLRHGVGARIVLAGLGQGDVAAHDPRPVEGGMAFRIEAQGRSLECFVPRPGVHMVHNAALAIAVGIEAGLTLEECRDGLRQSRFTGSRLQYRTLGQITFLDDSYNANPESVKAALAVLADVPTGRRWAVLGAMGELGEHAQTGYAEVGRACAFPGIDGLITLGRAASVIASAAADAGCPDVRVAGDHAEAARLLAEMISPGDTVLVKGSRSAQTEQVMLEFDKLAGRQNQEGKK